MSAWKELLTNTAADAEALFDTLKNRLSGRLDAEKPYKITYYRGLGGQDAVWLKGRVLRQRWLTTPSDRDTLWQNMLATYQRFGSDAVPGRNGACRSI